MATKKTSGNADDGAGADESVEAVNPDAQVEHGEEAEGSDAGTEHAGTEEEHHAAAGGKHKKKTTAPPGPPPEVAQAPPSTTASPAQRSRLLERMSYRRELRRR
jgi:hypothetical protein